MYNKISSNFVIKIYYFTLEIFYMFLIRYRNPPEISKISPGLYSIFLFIKDKSHFRKTKFKFFFPNSTDKPI